MDVPFIPFSDIDTPSAFTATKDICAVCGDVVYRRQTVLGSHAGDGVCIDCGAVYEHQNGQLLIGTLSDCDTLRFQLEVGRYGEEG